MPEINWYFITLILIISFSILLAGVMAIEK